MAGVIGKVTIAILVCAGTGGCSSDSNSTPQAATTSPSIYEQSATATPAATTTPAPTTTSTCVGLSICTPPPPDAEGNPPCNYRDGWEADPSGSGINVYHFREPSNTADAEQVTADVRLKDGGTASQIAVLEAGQSFHRIQFPGIDKAAVQEVLLDTSAGRCFVIGPDGG